MEQWEIDLQNEFSKNTPQNQTVIAEKPVVDEPKQVDVVQNTPVQNGNNNFAFLALLVMLTIAIFWVYDMKSGGRVRAWAESLFTHKSTVVETPKALPKPSNEQQQVKIEPKKFDDPDIAKLRTDFNKLVEDNKGKLDDLSGKLNITAHKVMLMGMLLNENFNILQQNVDKGDFIFFNRDWTLDRMPKYIELSESDREYLQKYVK
jgi:hypothetical protein